MTQKALGLDLAALSPQLRTKFKVKETVKGVVITSVEGNRDAAEKRLSAGDVIMEVAQEAVTNVADIRKRVDQLKKDGKKTALLTVANPDGEVRFVTLGVHPAGARPARARHALAQAVLALCRFAAAHPHAARSGLSGDRSGGRHRA